MAPPTRGRRPQLCHSQRSPRPAGCSMSQREIPVSLSPRSSKACSSAIARRLSRPRRILDRRFARNDAIDVLHPAAAARVFSDRSMYSVLTRAVANVARLSGVFDRPSSECFDGQRKHIADAAFGQDDARRVWIGLQLAPQAQYLNVDTAIENIFVGA